MSDTIIVGFTGEYRWTRRPVWLWNVSAYEANGWTRDLKSFPLRPTMIFRERRPNGAQPFHSHPGV